LTPLSCFGNLFLTFSHQLVCLFATILYWSLKQCPHLVLFAIMSCFSLTSSLLMTLFIDTKFLFCFTLDAAWEGSCATNSSFNVSVLLLVAYPISLLICYLETKRVEFIIFSYSLYTCMLHEVTSRPDVWGNLLVITDLKLVLLYDVLVNVLELQRKGCMIWVWKQSCIQLLKVGLSLNPPSGTHFSDTIVLVEVLLYIIISNKKLHFSALRIVVFIYSIEYCCIHL
jgi:hypothetical protein